MQNKTTANATLEPVTLDQKEILKNLLEKYAYEFSQYVHLDVNPLGLYGYEYLDHYWTEPNRWAYFIKVGEKLAGFVMINDYPEAIEGTDYTMSEFFVMHKYRGAGVGRYAAFEVFSRFKGTWQLKRHPHNTGSVHFWDKVVNQYTQGNYQLYQGHPDAL